MNLLEICRHRRRTFWWALTAVLLLLAGAGLWGSLAGGWEGGNTVGTWVQAIGTVGAFIAALFLYARETDRDHRAKLDRRRAQAEQVAAWYGSEERKIDHGAGAFVGQPGQDQQTVWRLWVRNASDLPVFAVRPRVYDATTGRELQVHETAGQIGSQFLQDLAQRDLGRGRPYQPHVRAMLPPRTTVDLHVNASDHRSVRPTVDLEFRDNAGRWWESAGGVLREIDPPA